MADLGAGSIQGTSANNLDNGAFMLESLDRSKGH